MNRLKWYKYLVEAEEPLEITDQVIYEVAFLVRFPSTEESKINFTKLKDEVRAIQDVTIVKTFEVAQILAGFTYKELVLKVALGKKESINEKVKETILPKLKDEVRAIQDVTIVKTFEVTQILAGFTYKELVLKVALDKDTSIYETVKEVILPKLKEIEEFIVVRILSIDDILER